MPCTATFDLPKHWGEGGRELAKKLDELVEIIVNTVPMEQWYGIIRWGEAMGTIGTPRYNEEGAVIYRLER